LKVCGLQWLHRLCQEPKRLWRRYLINNPKFVYEVARQFMGLSKIESGPKI
jgi:N-acetylglucosaminyldiphosphoundecaprenol N-acetyl-beta-D-mannosaminyltransferase